MIDVLVCRAVILTTCCKVCDLQDLVYVCGGGSSYKRLAR